ncbi:MAG: GAF domain-containing protein [Caldilineaceae bacterium]|nr:GAF domain-containing protein [Caldilineaceae bacterium]
MEATRRQLAEQSRHLHMLYQVTAQLNRESDLAGVIGVTLESLWHAVDLDFVAILLGDDELGPFHYAGVRGVDDPLAVLGQECELPLWGTLAHALVNHPQDGEPDYLVVDDIEAEARPTPGEFPWQAERGSLMIIPMRQTGRTEGAFLLGSQLRNHFSSEAARHFVYAIAGAAARAIQETQSRRQSVRWINQLISLQSLTHTITKTRDLDTILNVLYSELTDLFGEADIRVVLNHTERHERLLLAATPLDDGRFRLFTPQPRSADEDDKMASEDLLALVNWVMEAEQPLFFEPGTHPRDVTDFYYRASGRGLMVPIGEEKPDGVIYLSAPKRATPFEEGDLIVVRTISNSIAIALGAIELYAQLNGKASDALGIYIS